MTSPASIPEELLAAESAWAHDAIDILKQYAEYIRHSVKADDLERHPYLPRIEGVISEGRAAIKPMSDAEYWRLRSHGPMIDEILAARVLSRPSVSVDEVSETEHAFAEYEGVTAKELAETVARYGKALKQVDGLIDAVLIDPDPEDALARMIDVVRAALLAAQGRREE